MVIQNKFAEILDAANVFNKIAKEAAVRSRGTCVFPAEHPKVTDDKDHFPIGNKDQAKNALSRANQYSKAPPWYSGTLQSLVSAVARKVHKMYPSIEISEAGKTPGRD